MAESVEEVITRIKSTTCYYKMLNVPKDCDEGGIKKAYRKLALLLHPDKCKAEGAEDAFKSVSTAYNCLSSSTSRRTYDMTGSESDVSSGGPNFHGVDPNEIFEQFFRQHGEMGGMGGQTFYFSTGGGGPTFSFGGPGMGGFSNIRGFSQRANRDRSDDSQGMPGMEGGSLLNTILTLLPKLGILFPLIVVILVVVLFALVQVLMRRIVYLLPILIFAPSHLKWRLVSVVLFLHFFDILP